MKNASARQQTPFVQQATETLNRLRIACAELIAALPGELSKAVDLQRVLRLDMKLSWKVFRVATAPSPLAAGPYVPGPANSKALLKAAMRQSLPAEITDELAVALAEFERLVADTAGDRPTFDSMIYSLVRNQDAEQFALNQRKAAYRANRHIHGSLAKAQSTLVFIQPSASSSQHLDLVLALGHRGIQRLREDAPLPTSFAGVLDDEFHATDSGEAESVSAESASEAGLSLLRDFCSQPLPEFSATRSVNGRVYGQLVTPDIGMQGAVDWFTGMVLREAAPRWRAENNLHGIIRSEAKVPCEAFYLTLLLHNETYGLIRPELSVFKDTLSEPPKRQEDQRLDFLLTAGEQVQHLGRGPAVLHTPDVPRMAEMARYVFEQMEWDASAFDVYQVRIAYPVTPSTVFISYDLPESLA